MEDDIDLVRLEEIVDKMLIQMTSLEGAVNRIE